MLEVELDQTAECCNPACRAEIAPPDDQHRFCPECGAAQVFECEACPTRPGALLRVAEDSVCPRCGAVYVLCAACRFPLQVTAAGALTCPEGCAAGLTEARAGTCAPLANVARTGSVSVRAEVSAVGDPQKWELRESVGRPVCRFGRLYVLTGRGVVRCLDEATGQDAPQWRLVPVMLAGAAPPADATLQASERFVAVGWGGQLVACAITDGELAFRLQTSLRNVHWALHDDRLLLCGLADATTLRVELRDTSALSRGEDGLLWARDIPATAQGRRTVNWPAAAGRTFVFADLDGNVLRVGARSGEEFAPLLENPGYSYVSAPALMQGQASAVVHASSRGGALVRVPLDGSRPLLTSLQGLTPAYLGPRTTSRCMYLFDGRRDFYELDLQTPSRPLRPIFLGVELGDDAELQDFLMLEDRRGRGAWLVSLAGAPGALMARMVHTDSQLRPTIGEGRVGSLALAASDRRLFICDLQSGEVFVHHIPTA